MLAKDADPLQLKYQYTPTLRAVGCFYAKRERNYYRPLFHRACASSSHPTWCIWCQSSYVNNFFTGSVSVQKNQNVYHPKRWQKSDSILTVFLVSFYENDSAVLTEKNAISSRLLCFPTVNSAFDYTSKHSTPCNNAMPTLFRSKYSDLQ